MGKTPKEKHGNERRRPYNYPRNAQAQTRNSGTESRNYSYPSGNVPRSRSIPVYNLQYPGLPGPLPNQPYFGAGRGYRGRLRGINKPLKPIFNRQRRPDLRNRRVLSPLHKRSTRNNMQSQPEGQELLQDKHEGTGCQAEGTNSEKIVKNGPENCSSHEDLKNEVVVKPLQIENGSPEVADNGTTIVNDNTAVKDEPEKMPKSKSKEKKSKKSTTPSKGSPKGKQSPKSKKEPKIDVEEKVEVENKEKDSERQNKVDKEKDSERQNKVDKEKDSERQNKKVDKEKDSERKNKKMEKEKDSERLNKKMELEARNQESASPERQIQSNVKTVLATPAPPPPTEPEMNDSVVEIPRQNKAKTPETAPSTSAEENSVKLLETHNVKDSPRRSTRLTTRQSPPKPRISENPDSSSVIVLDSDDSISIMEVSRASQDRSFAQSLRTLSGRRALRPLPVYNRSFNRPCPTGSASIRSTISSKSGTTTGNDSESEETKSLQSKSGLWGLFRTSQNSAFHDPATDNEELTNRSVADDSGNDSEATTEPFEAPSNLSFGKRKTRDLGLTDEAEQMKKRIRAERIDQRNNANTSSKLLNMMSSPMHLFASKIRSDKAKSSTPVQTLKSSDMDDETTEELMMQQDNASDIQFEDDNPTSLSEKESLTDVSSKVEEEVAPRRWCSIM